MPRPTVVAFAVARDYAGLERFGRTFVPVGTCLGRARGDRRIRDHRRRGAEQRQAAARRREASLAGGVRVPRGPEGTATGRCQSFCGSLDGISRALRGNGGLMERPSQIRGSGRPHLQRSRKAPAELEAKARERRSGTSSSAEPQATRIVRISVSRLPEWLIADRSSQRAGLVINGSPPGWLQAEGLLAHLLSKRPRAPAPWGTRAG
jgi:hypothetical protein